MLRKVSHFSLLLNSRIWWLVFGVLLLWSPVTSANSLGDCIPDKDRDGTNYSIVSSTKVGGGGVGEIFEIEAINSDTLERERYILKTFRTSEAEMGNRPANLLKGIYNSPLGQRFNRIIDSRLDCYFKGENKVNPVTKAIILEKAEGSVDKMIAQWALTKNDLKDPKNLEKKLALYEKFDRQMSEALLALESEHLVHGDIKPGNILYKMSGEAEGLAPEAIDFQLTDFDSLQKDGAFIQVSTPEYSPPEVASGRTSFANKSFDHYSVGRSLEKLMFNAQGFRSVNDEKELAQEFGRIDGQFAEFTDLKTTRPDLYQRLQALKGKIKGSMNFNPLHRIEAFGEDLSLDRKGNAGTSTADALLKACGI